MSLNQQEFESETESAAKQAQRIEEGLKKHYKCSWCKAQVGTCQPECPNVKKVETEFTKFDSGKIRYSLFPPKALKFIVRILEYGANKYSPNNWRKVDDKMRYYDAAMRHLELWRSGEQKDPESGYPHLWHAACNLIFLVELE